MSNSQRIAYGETLVDLGKDNSDIVVLEADLGKSTMGSLFEEAYPNRFFEMGIAESNMASAAAGLSLTGKIPFMASFAVFSTGRCYDQIRTNVCIPGLNVKICGSSAGMSDFGDGSTHQSIDDMALMRVLPNMQVFSPVDATETRKIVRYMAENQGPMYIRINRNDLPPLSNPDEDFVPGKVYTLREGTDVAIFATGVMVSRSLEAAEELSDLGISAKVVNVPSIKPLSSDDVIAAAKGITHIVTAEEHSVFGGLGDAICAVLGSAELKKYSRVGVNDRFGTSAENYEVLLEEYGLNAAAVKSAVSELLGK